MHVPPLTTRRVAALALTAAAGAVLVPPAAAHAASAPAKEGRGTGPSGQTLTVSRADGLPAKGATVRVRGTGYNTGKGVYVALCRDNGAGKAPSPCGGGADTTGKAGASQWVSSNPPPYGKGLAVPYGPGGTFDVTLRIGAALSAGADCAEVRCAVVTRADHTRTSDRSQDVRVPVTFGDGGTPAWVWAASGAGAVVVVAGAAFVLLRRRRTPAGTGS
ncbi:hypothetical protein AGRA3207_003320 [Actinomadura graeca]|uniref:LPXTG cell wall anchor domain-containing protein n=1 Tax=Actinomadura graeca TaxID=2750812 RepID=A0ABX8QU50_9ACTN|nr:hypothetical protein [Actinomadura graeca]QXJ22334.1 hypothetical protein AGRA3207_003320 [Actinomadura graeca]